MPTDLRAFYEQSYSAGDADGIRYARWRALGARGKTDHVLGLLPQLDEPVSVLDVGCGDAAVLQELRRRRPTWTLAGVEIAPRAVEIARGSAPFADIVEYDGEHLPHPDHAFTVGILSHVLEHVPDPGALLAETARVCRWVIAEVPLEDNVSAQRGSKRAHGDEIGHLHAFSRVSFRAVVERAGLRVGRELADALPRAAHAFFAETPRARAVASAKWATRTGLHRLSPAIAERVFTVHYAVLCWQP